MNSWLALPLITLLVGPPTVPPTQPGGDSRSNDAIVGAVLGGAAVAAFISYLGTVFDESDRQSADTQARSAAEHIQTGIFNRSLGVECTHCHVQNQWNDDSKPAFGTARNMLRMVDVLNARLDAAGRISCITCHGGELRPSRQPRAALDEHLARWPAELADAPENRRVTMASYAIALGVTCDHCHTADWAARIKDPIKKVALMNSLFDEFPKYMPATARTQCFMCHKGATKPR
jgi:hypothetical protein